MFPVIMKAVGLALLMFALPLTLADPVHSVRGEHLVRQDTDLLPSKTDTSAQSSATTLIIFSTMNDFTACTSATIQWISGGPPLPITLSISDVGVIQSGAPSSSPSTSKSGANTLSNIATALGGRAVLADGMTVFTIAQSVDSRLGSYTWNTVNVSQGWYRLIAQADDKSLLTFTNINLFVKNGTDTSCLAPPSNTQSNPSSTDTSPPTNTNTGSPSTGAIQSKHLNVGAIVGGVIGGVALLALVALASRCMSRRRKSHTSVATGNGGDKSGVSGGGSRPGVLPFGKWRKLGSGSFNDKDRAPAIGHGGNITDRTVVSATSTGRPRSSSYSGGGFMAGVPKSSTPKLPLSKQKQYRHNSHSESIGGMLSNSATTSTTGSSAFHGTDDDYLYSYERNVPMAPISAGGTSTASSMRNPGIATGTQSPFSDPSDNDSDNIVYGLYGMTRNTGVIPIAYDGPLISSSAPTPSPVPSSYLYESSTGAVAGHSSDSDTPSRRNSRGHPDRVYPFTSFRDGLDQQDRQRAQTLLGGMYTLPNSQQQSLPETPRNDSLLTFSSTSSSGGGSKLKRTRSKSLHESTLSSSELYDLSTTSPPQTPALSTPTAFQAPPSIQSPTIGNSTGGTPGASTTRRTPRKPVPSYSPDDFAGASVPGGSSSVFSSPTSSPTEPSPLTTVEGVVSEGQREVFRQHELLHKDSVGSMKGTKMHVLMPDMPPPQRH